MLTPSSLMQLLDWFAAAGLAAAGLILWAHKMHPVGTFEYLLQVSLGILGLLLFAVSTGCGLSVFLYRRKL